MKRHDTHLLSDESDKEGKEEDDHKYIFNSSNNSSKDSEEKLITKDSKENIPIKNIFFNKNKKFSKIISTKELDNIIGVDINENRNLLKRNRNKNIIKVKKLKINKENNKQVEYNCLTYNPSLTNNIIDKNIKNINKRKCISLVNIDKNNKKVKPKITNYDNLKEKEIYYYVFKGNFEGYNKIKKYMNILNKQKLKLLQISKSNFSLKTKKKKNINRPNNNNYPFLENKNNNHFNKNNYNFYNNKIKQPNIYYGTKLNRLSPNKFQNENDFILNKNKISLLKSYKNLYNSLNINYFPKSPNKSKPLKSKKMKKKIKNKIEMMYNIYIGNNAKNYNFQQMKLNDSIFDNQKKRIWTKKKNSKKFMNFCYGKYNRDIINNLKKIQQRDIFTNFNNFNIHCGNNDSCPVCQSIEHKNEDSILKKGIHPMTSNIGNNDTSKNSWQKRRVYSALSRILTRKVNKNYSEFDEIYDNINSNLSRCLSISRNNNNTNKSKLDDLKKKIINKGVKNYLTKNRNDGFRKLNLNRSISLQNNYSTSNRFYSSKNQSIISN